MFISLEFLESFLRDQTRRDLPLPSPLLPLSLLLRRGDKVFWGVSFYWSRIFKRLTRARGMFNARERRVFRFLHSLVCVHTCARVVVRGLHPQYNYQLRQILLNPVGSILHLM